MAWTLEMSVFVQEDGQARSLTSHKVFELDNETADKGAEALVLKIIEQVHEWQEYKKSAAANYGENPNGLIKSR